MDATFLELLSSSMPQLRELELGDSTWPTELPRAVTLLNLTRLVLHYADNCYKEGPPAVPGPYYKGPFGWRVPDWDPSSDDESTESPPAAACEPAESPLTLARVAPALQQLLLLHDSACALAVCHPHWKLQYKYCCFLPL